MRVLLFLAMMMFSFISFAQDAELDFSTFDEETKACVFNEEEKQLCNCTNPKHVEAESVCVKNNCCVKQASTDLGDAETQCTGYVNSEGYGSRIKDMTLDENGKIISNQ